ncbi:hypothetical protein ABZP36_036162 [Zizania latifolia]
MTPTNEKRRRRRHSPPASTAGASSSSTVSNLAEQAGALSPSSSLTAPADSSSSPPVDLIPDVARLLTSLEDFFSLRAACRAYLAALPTSRPLLASQAPLLLVNLYPSFTEALFHPRLRRLHRFRLPWSHHLPPSRYTLFYAHGFLVTATTAANNYPPRLLLLHLFTGEQLRLPKVPAPFSRVILTDDLLVVIFLPGRATVQHCHPGDALWRVASTAAPHVFHDLIFVNRTLYALVGLRLATLELSEGSLELSFLGGEYDDTNRPEGDRFMLGECGGEVLLISEERVEMIVYRVFRWVSEERKWPALLPANPLAGRCRRGRGRGRGVRWRCATGEGPGGGGGGEEEQRAAAWLSSAVGEKVDELLQREENRALLEGVEAAERRVERARAALADIERQEAAARLAREEVRRLERRRDEIAESQRELLQAREMIDEAQRSLSSSFEDQSFGDVSSGDIDEDSERLESVKAAAVSSVVGVLASLPISFYEAHDLSQLFVQLSVIFISCALFGVTFRYAIRRDLDNVQLKTGAAAAFAFVRGLAMMESGVPFEPSTDALISLVLDGAISVVENIFTFLPAAIALDYCFKMRFLSPFPTRKQ